MSIKLLMTTSEVVDYAFATGEYVAEGSILETSIMTAQQRYIIPIVGQKLFEAIVAGRYEMLREEYIAPTLGILARIESNLPAYPPTATERQRGKLFLRNLSDYLNSSTELYAEYDPEGNVLNRCQIVGGFVI